MEIHRFFANFQAEGNPARPMGLLALDDEESHHAIRVLRLKAGEMVEVINGQGLVAAGQIATADPRQCQVNIQRLEAGTDVLPAQIHIAIAPPKNIARLEWFLEKATEIGISRITPIHCNRSARMHLNVARLEKVIRAAVKQSLRTYLPALVPMQDFRSFIAQEESKIRLLAYLNPGYSQAIKDVYSPRENVTILIGPEGDFDPEEVELAQANGYIPIMLGSSRLRTETAALMACAVINMINGQL